MAKFGIGICDEIAQKCINLYNTLPKTGKPMEGEWTVLSCIVQYDEVNNNIEIVSLGTGSKCVGASKMSSQGNILNDSHAEVIARRGFLVYLYENIDKAICGQSSIFKQEHNQFKLKDHIEFAFYSSQMPCGDASIILKTSEEDYGDVLNTQKREAESEVCTVELKKTKLELHDIHRTGAKCLPYANQDPKQPGLNYHLLGEVRTKPGRGDRTLSVSCSDKIAKWVHLGIQGALLDLLLCKPIYVKYFIFGNGVPYSEETLIRAILKRNKCSESLVAVEPKFFQSSLSFPDVKGEKNVRPAPGSILWIKIKSGVHEVIVQGKKLGVTKKKVNDTSTYISICKYNIYQKFLEILCKTKVLKQNICGDLDITFITYNEMKSKSKQYNSRWCKVREGFFKTWTKKPQMWNFYINTNN